MKRTISKMLAAGFAATLLTLPASRIAAQITIVPQPQEVKLQAGKASVSANPKVYLDKKQKSPLHTFPHNSRRQVSRR